jgi:hypothetical protein
MTAQPVASPAGKASPHPAAGEPAAGDSARRLKHEYTHRRWTKADNAAWWAARRAALKARGKPARDTCVDGAGLFERFVYRGEKSCASLLSCVQWLRHPSRHGLLCPSFSSLPRHSPPFTPKNHPFNTHI